MSMNLDVAVRLIDQTSRPARDATAALEKFGNTANRLTNRLAAPTRALRGFSSALRDVKAADGAADRATASTGRLKSGMAAIGPAARTASTGLDRFGRAADRLASAARKATGETRQLRAALGSSLPSGGFASSAQAQLRSIIALQRQALGNMRQLNAGGGGAGRGGRRGMGGSHGGGGAIPGLALALQPTGHEALHSIYEQATSLQDAIVKMHLNGLSDSEIASVRAKAAEVAATNKSTNPLANINAIMEARLALGGDLEEALATAGEMSKLRTIVGFSLGKDRAKAAEDGVYDMLRTGELRGVINDPARREALFKGMSAALIASNGRITPKDWHQTAMYGRSATQGLSDDFVNGRLPFLMQELKGGRGGGQAGVALQALFRALPLAIGKASNIPEWRRLGLIDESRVVKGNRGSEKMLPGAITIGQEAISDPDRAVFKLMDAMRAHGITERGAMIREIAQLVGTGTGQTAVDVLGLQRSRLENFDRTLKLVEDDQTIFAQINETASQSVTNLNAQMDALKGNIGSSVIPAFGTLVDGTTRFVGVMNRVAGLAGGNGNDPVNGAGGGASLYQLGLLGGGGMLGLAKLAATRPWLARLLAGGAGAAATGNQAGALLGPTLLAAAQRLASLLPGAVRAGLVSGIRGGIVTGLAYEGGKALISGALSFLPGPQLTPEKQARADADARQDAESWIWQKPGLIKDDITHRRPSDFMPGGSRYGQPIPEDLKPYVKGTGTPIAGARALGGPVGSGKSYLVGERGPEIFTPGLSGAISTHAATKLALAGGAANDAGDGETAREVRYLSFALVSAVDGISKSLDRLHLDHVPAALGGGLTGSSAGGDTDGSGFAAGGRRGFMSRGGSGRAGGWGGGVGDDGKRLAGQGAVPGDVRARALRAMSRLVAHGWTPEAAATAIGQAVQESKVRSDGPLGDTKRFGFGDKAAHGMFQWRDQRFRDLKAFAKGRGKDWQDFDTQVDFFDAEARKSYHGDAWKKTTDLMQGNRFGRHFEGYGDNSFGTRLDNARRLIGAYRAGGGVPLPQEEKSAAGHGAPALPARQSPAGGVPEVLAERARRQGERDRDFEAERAPRQKGDSKPGMHVGEVHVHVAAQPHHDERKIAAAVHERFNEAMRVQLNDGAFA